MAQRLKMAFIILTSAITSAGAMYFTSNIAHQASAFAQQNNAKQLHKKIAQLQQENAQLHLRIKQRESATTDKPPPVAETQSRLTTNATSSMDTKQTVLAQPLQDEQIFRASENFSTWLVNTSKEKGQLNLREEMQRRFDAEAVDHTWAESQEQEYLTLFSQSPELAGLALRETQCRTRQCALTVSISDIGQANALLEKMTKTLQQKKQYPMIIATPDEQRGITTLYIGKDANSFEFN